MFNTLLLCLMFMQPMTPWENDIHNPGNEEFVIETAFNLCISVDSVTQVQFNNRYKLKN